MKALRDDNRQFKSIIDEKIKEIEPLNQALGKLRNANNVGRNGGLCSSEEELNAVIQSLQYHIQHESIPLSEEKQILREIKQLEGTREKVIANAAMRTKLQDSMVQKEALQDQVKIISGDLDGVRKEQQAVRAKIKQLDDALKAIDNEIKTL
ncbi:proton pump-interactor 1-like [Cucumis melo]|uniref:Proton pump-interactor 1-like n=1 Tax=Cucumis melo TaxID=3656 RepID=A0A9I9DWJ0_CUCME|nr:proton pump-interactor 1-like [Cucumis melo]